MCLGNTETYVGPSMSNPQFRLSAWTKGSLHHTEEVKLSEVGVLSVYFGAVIKGSLNGLSGWLGPWQQAEDRQCPGHLLP